MFRFIPTNPPIFTLTDTYIYYWLPYNQVLLTAEYLIMFADEYIVVVSKFKFTATSYDPLAMLN